MGWAVPGAGGSSVLRHNTAPQQEDLERDRTVQWDPMAGPCPVPLEARSQQPGGSPGWGVQGAPCHSRPHLVLGQLDLAALQVEAQQRGALQLLRGVGQPLQQLLQLVLELPQAQQGCLQLVLLEARAGSGTRSVGSALPMHPAPCTQPHEPTLLQLSPRAHLVADLVTSSHATTASQSCHPIPVPCLGPPPTARAPLTWRLTISSSRRSQRCRKSLSGAGGSPCPCPPGPAWCRRLSTSTLHW